MIQMNSDVARHNSLSQASIQARNDDFDYTMHRTMDERLGDLRAKNMRPKKRLPWVTIISIISVVPFFFIGGMPSIPLQSMIPQKTSEHQLHGQLNSAQADEKATVSVTIGGRTIRQELSISEIQALQALQNQ